MKNKKTVMTVAALLILVFHLWVQVFPGNIAETFLRQIGYIGVDMFFLLSAYSIGSRPVENYRDFLKSRFIQVYLRFLVFSILACFTGHWQVFRLIRVILGIEFLQKGGGSFLWYVPAVMLLYVFLPLYQKAWLHSNTTREHQTKFHQWLPILVLAVWFLIGLLITHGTSYKAMFIWWNRIPIILLGFHLAQHGQKQKSEFSKESSITPCLMKVQNLSFPNGLSEAVLLTAFGFVLLWYFGFRPKLQVPLRDMFYIMAIPAALGLVLLTSRIPENRVIREIGNATLEMYALQMIFGYDFAGWILKTVQNKLFSNLLTILSVVGLAVIWKRVEVLLAFMLQKIFKKTGIK